MKFTNPVIRLVSVCLLFAFGATAFAGGAPMCVSTTQSPDTQTTPVDVGTVVTLSLTTSGAVSAEIDGTPMNGGPDSWTATHVVVVNTVISAVIDNGAGGQASCEWVIDTNCSDPSISDVAEPGNSGVTISGDNDCTYTVRVIDDMASMTDFNVQIFGGGMETLNVVVPANGTIQVGQFGLPVVTDSFMTTPVELLQFEID